jgi:DNA-binding LacI/PurR family transcriptional regulator
MPLPQRVSLVSQVLDLLRSEISAGRWKDRLPGERDLCGRFQVCRSTLRGALAELERRGLLETRQKRRWIRVSRMRGRPAAFKPKVIGWLSTEPLERLPQYKLFQLDEVRRLLQAAGYALETHFEPRLKDQAPEKTLEALANLVGASSWILTMATPRVQEWFVEAGIPCVLAGSQYPRVPLPALDFNYRAVSRHAAGLFRSRGHRRVACLLPSRLRLQGDVASLQGFREGMVATPQDAPPEVLHGGHDGTVPAVCAVLDELFMSRNPPTGLFVSHPGHLLTVISHLGRLRRRVPEEVSVVVRHYDSIMDNLDPAVDGYEFNMRLYTTRLSQMAVQLAEGGVMRNRQYLLMGRYREGGSLAPLAKGA